MQVTISAKHMELTQPIREYVERKMARLPHFFDRVQEIRVVLERIPNGFHVEVMSNVEHHADFVANTSHRDLYAGIDLAMLPGGSIDSQPTPPNRAAVKPSRLDGRAGRWHPPEHGHCRRQLRRFPAAKVS